MLHHAIFFAMHGNMMMVFNAIEVHCWSDLPCIAKTGAERATSTDTSNYPTSLAGEYPWLLVLYRINIVHTTSILHAQYFGQAGQTAWGHAAYADHSRFMVRCWVEMLRRSDCTTGYDSRASEASTTGRPPRQTLYYKMLVAAWSSCCYPMSLASSMMLLGRYDLCLFERADLLLQRCASLQK